MTKHIAIQLFGYLRTFEKTYTSLYKNIIQPQQNNGYQVDIFIHTWDTTNTTQTCGGASNLSTIKKTESIKNKIMKYYNPRKLEIDEQFNISDEKIPHLAAKRLDNADMFVPYNRLYNQYYTMYRVNKIRQEYERANGIKYDLVIQTRPDILFIDKLDIEAIIRRSKLINESLKLCKSSYSIDDMPLFTVCSCKYPYVLFLNPAAIGATDVCFFGLPENIDRYTQLFTDFDMAIKHGFFSHEAFLHSYATDRQWGGELQIQAIPYLESINYKIIRVKPRLFLRLLTCMIPIRKWRHKIRSL